MAILLEILGKHQLQQGEVHKFIILGKADRDLSCKEDKKIALAIPSLLPSQWHVHFPTEGSRWLFQAFHVGSPSQQAGSANPASAMVGAARMSSDSRVAPHRLVLSHGLQLGDPKSTQAKTLPGADES